MHCKHCGKAIGTDRGICPFCGAMLTMSQYEIYKQDKKENFYKPELLQERYGEKKQIYEQRKEGSNIIFIMILIILLIIIIGIIIAFLVLK